MILLIRMFKGGLNLQFGYNLLQTVLGEASLPPPIIQSPAHIPSSLEQSYFTQHGGSVTARHLVVFGRHRSGGCEPPSYASSSTYFGCTCGQSASAKLPPRSQLNYTLEIILGPHNRLTKR